MDIKPIETTYNGYKFRSRLEARWAIYFDTLGIAYYYEHEGYDLGEVGWYLPDFYLPQMDWWAEVKPVKFSAVELKKLRSLVLLTKKPALMLVGPPERKTYTAICYDAHCRPNGLYSCDFILLNYYNRNSFYGDPSKDEIDSPVFNNISIAVEAAKSARF